MGRTGLRFLKIFFLVGLGAVAYLGLDTTGRLPWQVPRLDKVSDLGRSLSRDTGKRVYLIKRKFSLSARLRRFKGARDRREAARKALDEGMELFALKQYDKAEERFRKAADFLSRRCRVPVHGGPAAAATGTGESGGRDTGKASAALDTKVEKSLEARLDKLEERLNAITDPEADTDEAWLLMDKAFNAMRAGDERNARYFITEASIKIDDLESP